MNKYLSSSQLCQLFYLTYASWSVYYFFHNRVTVTFRRKKFRVMRASRVCHFHFRRINCWIGLIGSPEKPARPLSLVQVHVHRVEPVRSFVRANERKPNKHNTCHCRNLREISEARNILLQY